MLAPAVGPDCSERDAPCASDRCPCLQSSGRNHTCAASVSSHASSLTRYPASVTSRRAEGLMPVFRA
eukprot:12625035-Alexandrium_andersonii.AAC.1